MPQLRDLWFYSVVSEKHLGVLLETAWGQFELVLQLQYLGRPYPPTSGKGKGCWSGQCWDQLASPLKPWLSLVVISWLAVLHQCAEGLMCPEDTEGSCLGPFQTWPHGSFFFFLSVLVHIFYIKTVIIKEYHAWSGR